MMTPLKPDSVFRKLANETKSETDQASLQERFKDRAVAIYNRHFQQTRETVDMLQAKYSVGRIGAMTIYEAFLLLARCIDPSDIELYATNQLIHSLQVVEAMEADGMPEEIIVVGLVHDIGKILMLIGEAAHHIVCPNEPIGTFSPGIGLDNIVVNWNHDEYAYQKLKPYLSEDQNWLLRYHSLRFDKAEAYLSCQDKERMETLLKPFRHYDLWTKTPYYIPIKIPEDYQDLLDTYFPEPVAF